METLPELPAEEPPISGGAAACPERRPEIPVSTVVHLMGLASAAELRSVEAKLDLLTTKMTAVALKVERMAAQISFLEGNLALDRVEFQLSDIRTAMKKLFPQLLGSMEAEKDVSRSAAKVENEEEAVVVGETAPENVTEEKTAEGS